jgi:hypothetical protein
MVPELSYKGGIGSTEFVFNTFGDLFEDVAITAKAGPDRDFDALTQPLDSLVVAVQHTNVIAFVRQERCSNHVTRDQVKWP